MAKHNGIKKRTRYKLQKGLRERGMPNVTSVIQHFDEGQKVHIVMEPSVQKGMPHPRFPGKTGPVRGPRGRAWILEIKHGTATTVVISRPQHLKAQKY